MRPLRSLSPGRARLIKCFFPVPQILQGKAYLLHVPLCKTFLIVRRYSLAK